MVEAKIARAEGTVRSSRGEATRRRILNAAEELYAQKGFKAVSLRMIASHAEVELGLITYYFGSRLSLIEKVLARRANAGERAMAQALDQVEHRGDHHDVVAILTAFSETILLPLQRENLLGVNYMRLLIQFQRDGELREAFGTRNPIMMPHYPVRSRYIEALRRALPDVDPAYVLFGFEVFEGSFSKLLFDSEFDTDDAEFRRAKVAELRRCLVPFCAAGFRVFQPGLEKAQA